MSVKCQSRSPEYISWHTSDDLFRDKTCNWVHIISLFAFCLKELYTSIDGIALFIGSYIVNNLTVFIIKEDGLVFYDALVIFIVYELYMNLPDIFFNYNNFT